MVYRLTELIGFNTADLISGSSDVVHFGLKGDDVFQATSGTDEVVFIGGSGDDQYWTALNSITLIGEAGNSANDELFTQANVNSPNARAAIVDGRHLLAGDLDTGIFVLIADWEQPANQIETFHFADATLTFAQVQSLVHAGGLSYTWEQADAVAASFGLDLIPPGYTAADIDEAISYYANRAALIEFYGASSGNDSITGTPASDTIEGFAGNDTIAGGGEADSIYGGDGNDTLYSFSSDFAASVVVNDGANLLDGGNGNDLLRGSGAAETLLGGSGDDSLGGRGGADTIDGGPGADSVSIARTHLSTPYTFSFATGAGGDITEPEGARIIAVERLVFAGGDGVENVTGGINGDLLQGGGNDDVLVGFDGDDLLRGDAGNDTLAGQQGHDGLVGGEGNDLLFGGPGVDDLFGEEGNDNLYVFGNDGTLDGGDGYDQVIVLDTASVNITIGAGVEYVAGNNGNDVLSAAGTDTAIIIGGADGNDTLTGGSGNDTLAGMNGFDVVHGGAGNDLLFAGTGSDNFFGEDGDDKIYILGNDGTIDGGIGFDMAIVLDTAGVTITLGNGIEYAAGNNGSDWLDGSLLTTAMTLGGADGNDTVKGGSNNDIISGSNGSDTLYGNDGNDQLFGGNDNDALYGGRGNDNFTTGNGADVCFIQDDSDTDAVFGFADGQDTFDFSLQSSVNSLGDLVISESGGNTFVDFTGGQLIVVGVVGQIDISDFAF